MSIVAPLLPPTRYKMCMSLREGRRKQDEPQGPDIKYFFKEKRRKSQCWVLCLFVILTYFLSLMVAAFFSPSEYRMHGPAFLYLAESQIICAEEEDPRGDQ